MSIKKIYCYVDENGQDTLGRIFIVAIVVIGPERDELTDLCENLEIKSGKGKFKWGKSENTRRLKFMHHVCAMKQFREKIYYSVFSDTIDYDAATIKGIARALLHKQIPSNFTTNIYVDGLSKAKKHEYGRRLRKLGIPTHKVQGVKKDENSPLTRLADAVAGFIRAHLDRREKSTSQLYKIAIKSSVITEVTQ